MENKKAKTITVSFKSIEVPNSKERIDAAFNLLLKPMNQSIFLPFVQKIKAKGRIIKEER